MANETVQCCITSPPYWGLRDYGVGGQLGLEKTPEEYVANMVQVFREVWRVLRQDGVVWLNLGDSYWAYRSCTGHENGNGNLSKSYMKRAGGKAHPFYKPKDLVGIPWRVAFALQADGWWLRQDIIWHKSNPMPESVKDRCTKAHEYVFLLSKSGQYYYDSEAIKEQSVTCEGRPSGIVRDRIYGYNSKQAVLRSQRDSFKRKGNKNGQPSKPQKRYNRTEDVWDTTKRNKRSVWKIATKPYKGAHFATFPTTLVEPMILAGSREGDLVLDPFSGTATVGEVCIKHKRNFIGTELNAEYIVLARKRLAGVQIALFK